MFPAERYHCTYTSSSGSSNITTLTLGSGSSQIDKTGCDPKWVRIFNSVALRSECRERGKDEDACVLWHTKSKLYMESIPAERKAFLRTAATSKPQIFLDIWKNISWLIKDYRTRWILYLAKSNGASLIFQDRKLHLWWADVSFAEKYTTQSFSRLLNY